MHLPVYRKAKILILLVFISFCTMVSAQESKTNLIGVTALAELVSYTDISPAVGFVFERKLTRRSGLEIGTYYRTKRRDFQIDVTLQNGSRINETYSVRESYLTLPILYRFYTKAITLSVGPFVEAFVGWDQISKDEVVEVTQYEISPAVRYGPLFKVSKSFAIGKNLSLEPELRVGVMARPYEAFYGVGIQLKERMVKKN